MIEIRAETIEQDDHRHKRNHYTSWKLFHNQEVVQGLYVTGSEVQSFTKLTSILLSESSIYDYPKHYVIILKKLNEIDFWSIGVEIGKNALGIVGLNINPIQENEYLIKFVMTYDLNNWKERYSFLEYRDEFTKILDERDVFYLDSGNDLQIKDYEDRNGNKIISIAFHNFTKSSIYEDIEEYLDFLQNLHLDTTKNVQTKINENIVAFTFNFPEKLKISCEQYLLYFAQFLQDLGISAASNLEEEAGKVLFSITPTNDLEALDKIREALAVYLNLPSSPVLYNDSFQSMQLKQQVENLQHSQRMKEMEMRSAQYALRLAQQNIENQDKIITQQNSFIDNQNKIIEKITSKSIMMDSLENKEEFEKVFNGLEFGESKELKEKLGIKFKPVTFLKSLGRTISGTDDEITSLNLNDETDKNN